MRLGEILVADGVVTQDELDRALTTQSSRDTHQRLGRTIIDLGLCEESDIADALAHQLRLARVDLTNVGPTSEALNRVPRKLAERHQALPLRITDNDVLELAMSDPTNVVALDDIKLSSRAHAVRAVVATQSALEDALRRAYGSDTAALEMVDALSDSEVVSIDDQPPQDTEQEPTDDQPIIRLANAILADAVRTRASDVHVEPEREHVRVRYRIDGILRETMRVPKHIGPALTSRLKIMSNLDIAERRRPQDGRAMIRVERQEVDLRVSTMPTMFGETVVLRLLRKGAERLGIDDLGMPADLRELFESALHRPQGLVVITGPTGSGKTTTLYAGLTELADPIRNVITLEDPIEYQLEGINQTQVNPKIDLTFARGLRTVLRQDPDVVMVGEIRDQETAELAMEASFTGHLVLSTLHTNDAPSTIVRLVDLGVERFLIASSMLMVIAQRLTRVVCPHCRQRVEPDPKTMKLLGLTDEDVKGRELWAGEGCQVCEQTGYLGRLGIYEVLQITPQMRELIMSGGSETQISALGRAQGMRSLREDGLAKAYAGITTLEEVLRTTPEESLADMKSVDPTSVMDVVPPRPEVPIGAPEDATRAPWRTDGRPGHARPGTALQGPEVVDVDDVDDFNLRIDPESGRVVGGSVLVIDDDQSIREMLGELLADEWVVLEAVDGETGLQMQDTHRPDAVILDYRLPDLDGIEVTRQIRESEGMRHVPILMITGESSSEIEVEGLLAGVDDYLTKPLSGEVLRARLTAMVRRKFVG